MSKRSEEHRAYCFTINNYTLKCIEAVENVKCKYIVYGYEVCPTTGTPHIQGYVNFTSAKSMSACVKALGGRASTRVAKGSAEQNYDYCSKEGNFHERGDRPEQGERTDIEIVRETLKKTGSMRKVVDVAKNYQSIKMAELILKYQEPKRTWKPKVIWLYGETGSGKTKSAYEILGEDDVYTASIGKWFDGYDAHANVLLDDIRKEFLPFNVLLRLLDRYEHRVEVKGGSRQFLAKTIVVTAPVTPQEMYSNIGEDVEQLVRRIDEITEIIKVKR